MKDMKKGERDANWSQKQINEQMRNVWEIVKVMREKEIKKEWDFF